MKAGFPIILAGVMLLVSAAIAPAQRAGTSQGPSPTAAQAASPAAGQRRLPVKAMVMMTTAIPITDLERAKAFYIKGMGMTSAPGANPRELNLMFPGGGANIMLLVARTSAPARGRAAAPVPAAPAAQAPVRNADNRIILEVPSIRTLSDSLVAAGFPAITRITERPQYGLSVGYLHDPDGNSYELIQRY